MYKTCEFLHTESNKKIHFNPTKPENHNIYISNLKNNYVMIYNGNKWLIRDRDDSIQDIIDKNEGIIEQKMSIKMERITLIL